MTAEEWLDCTDPHRLLYGAVGRLPRWRSCMIAAALARRAARLVPPEEITPVLGRLERMGEPHGTPTEHGADIHAITAVGRLLAAAASRLTGADYSGQCTRAPSILTAVSDVAALARVAIAAAKAGQGRKVKALRNRERQAQRRLLREIVGNPFRNAPFNPDWRTSTAVLLARQMHDTGNFFPMPILADALQDADCDDEVILDHCRGEGPHVKGCWVVDLVLGKE